MGWASKLKLSGWTTIYAKHFSRFKFAPGIGIRHYRQSMSTINRQWLLAAGVSATPARA
jgi:kynureninase